jgi:hypothetical protein
MKLDEFSIIIIGVLLKMIDDFYDMHLFNKNIITIAQFLIILLSIFVFLRNKNWALMTLITCIYVLFAEGQMEDSDGKSVKFYYIFNIFTLGFFLYHLFTSGYKDTFNKITTIEIVRILLFGLFIYGENKIIPEDISKRKILYRSIIVILAILYLYYENFNNEHTMIVKNVYYLAIGYMSVSVINMLYKHLPKPAS